MRKNLGRLARGSAVGALLAATPAMAQVTEEEEVPPQTGTSEIEEENQIVVTGIRASLASSAEIKRNAEQIVDSITVQDIGALPDRSVSEALQRVPEATGPSC